MSIEEQFIEQSFFEWPALTTSLNQFCRCQVTNASLMAALGSGNGNTGRCGAGAIATPGALIVDDAGILLW